MIGGAVIVACLSACAAKSPPGGPVPGAPRASSCGSALTHGLSGSTQMLSAGPHTLSCFSKAAKTCKAASIKITEMGVDTGTYYVFTIEAGGKACLVTQASRDYSANFGGSQGPVRTTTCHTTAVTGRGVTLRCDGQDLLIPAKVSIPD